MSGALRVAMDATPAISGRTGIAVYVTELATALAKRGVDVRTFAVGRAVAPAPEGCRRFRLPSRIVHISWAVGGPPRPERLVGAVDVVHATGLSPPPSRVPVVATVHDVAALDHPHLHAPRLVRQMESLLRHLKRAAVVLAVSETTAATLRERGVPGDRIVVTYQGLRQLGESTPRRLVSEPYLLLVGEQMPRKGLRGFLDAFAGADLGGVRLVHAGPESSETAELAAAVNRLGLSDRVKFLGFVTREDLGALYRDALGLCFPSLAEGFGFPVLEAMAAGVPVLASDIPSVRELTADAATLLAPGDRDAWVDGLERFVRDDAGRADLSRRGRHQASLFTWDGCAASTLAAYERALAVGR